MEDPVPGPSKVESVVDHKTEAVEETAQKDGDNDQAEGQGQLFIQALRIRRDGEKNPSLTKRWYDLRLVVMLLLHILQGFLRKKGKIVECMWEIWHGPSPAKI